MSGIVGVFLEIGAVVNRERKPSPPEQRVGDRLAASRGQIRTVRPGIEGLVAEGRGDDHGKSVAYHAPSPLVRTVDAALDRQLPIGLVDSGAKQPFEFGARRYRDLE